MSLRAVYDLVKKVWSRLGEHDASILAAAVAFYSFLSIFPAVAALVSLYGLFANPAEIEHQVQTLSKVLPADAVAPISGWMNDLVQKPRAHFGIGLAIGVAISIWSARYAIGTLMTSLNVAYSVREQRSFVRYNVVAFLLTTVLIMFVGAAVILIALLPVLVGYMPSAGHWQKIALWIRWPALLAIVVVVVATLYRHAPNRSGARWEFTSAGALLATAGLLAGSYGFSLYVSTFGSYDKTYGAVGSVAVLLTWLWIAAYSLLAGAELNAAILRRL